MIDPEYWDETKPGWYEVHVHINPFTNSIHESYTNIITWLSEKVDNYQKHCRWTYSHFTVKVKFRYERDYIWFKLVWG
jgi:hypothetical protein